MAVFFEVLTQYDQRDGHRKIDSTQTAALCKPGRIVKSGSDQELEIASAGNTATGILYGLQGEAYDRRRNDEKTKYTNFVPGDYATIVYGQFIAQANDDCFDDTAIPAVGTSIYVGNSGFLSATASGSAIGVVQANDSVPNEAAGTDTVARIAFDIKGF